MKILLINNFHYIKGGSETVYFNTANLLRAHGHEVIFFSFIDNAVACAQDEYFDYRGGLFKRIRDYFWNTSSEKKLDSLLKRERPDIVHVHLFWGGLSPSILEVIRKYKIPVIHTVHDYRMVCPAYTFKNGQGIICEKCGGGHFINCLKYRCSKNNFLMSAMMTLEMYCRNKYHHPADNIDGFIYVSEFCKKIHFKYDFKLAKANSVVIYNYTLPTLEPIRNKKNYLLYYGRLSFEKGLYTLLGVIAKHSDIKLKVVGTGPIANELKFKYKKNNIEFVGYKSGNELFELVRDAKFVCVPSEWYENNPMTIIESYSLGTPVIGANIGGIPEIIDEGRTGFKFESGCCNSLEKTLIHALGLSEIEYESICDNAYEFYLKNFSDRQHYEKLMSFYNETMTKCGKYSIK